MYVVLDGVHGIGKTTICRELGKRNGIRVLPEIKDVILPPPVLGPQSSDKLKSQLWFLRQMILKNEKITNGSIVVSDRGITSVLLYSKVLLDEYEFELVKTIVNSLNLKEPDVEIILWAPDDVIEKRIKERSRNNKQKWSEDNLEYLKKLNGEFYKYYHNFKDLKPVYLVDASGTVEETCEKIEKIIFR